MKNMKRFFCQLTPALLSLALLAGCGGPDSNLRNTSKINDYGTVTQNGEQIDGYGTLTRNGEQINVCVCHDQKAVYLYYNDEEHELFDTAMLPTDEIYDYDKDWGLGRISLSDFTGDNNSDLQVYLSHSDMSESHIWWAWEEGEGYVYQPDNSWFYHSIVVSDPPYDDTANDFSMYEGLWLSDKENLYNNTYLQIDAQGNWQLYSDGDEIDNGYLRYETEEGITYTYSYRGGAIDGGFIKMEGDRLNINTCGYFNYLDGSDGQWQGAAGGNWDGENREDSEMYHKDVSAFEGTWYYDEDLSATTYIVIDGYGNWSYYQRTPGDAEGTKMDYGTFSYSTDEVSTYYADSAMDNGVRYRVFDFDEGVLDWDGDTYYRME